MKRWICLMVMIGLLIGCGRVETEPVRTSSSAPAPEQEKPGIVVHKVEGLDDGFILGADVSSLIAQERSGVVYRGFDGQPQDLLKTLSEAGVDSIRVRVWHDPYDAQGNGYGGGNNDLQTAITIGKRAAQYGMSLLVDFHYSDYWADPGKQQVPKAWEGLNFEEKAQAIRDYTAESLGAFNDAGVMVKMVQIGNETNGGFCGEWTEEGQYALMAVAAEAVREFDSSIQIVVHFTNPEKGGYTTFAGRLKEYQVDYDIFSTSYYPIWHGTLANLTAQLGAVADGFGKKVMVAETAWPYTDQDMDGHGNSVGSGDVENAAYPFSVQGQATAMNALIEAVSGLGDCAVGVYYWEPAWITVPGDAWHDRAALWERFGSGWASSYAGEFDPNDAGKYYGGSACDNHALFDSQGNPLESLMTFTYVRTGQTDDK
jgi:arabinogalactan endo-1,4-beta-galactosidase